MDRLIDNMTAAPVDPDAWLNRIYRERQLQKLDQQDSLQYTECKYSTNSNIVLDGFFNEAVWNQDSQHKNDDVLKGSENKGSNSNDVANAISSLKFAYDQEYLYVSIRQRRDNDHQISIPKARNRDEDLTDFSRIEICIDVDRDYASAYQFVVDERGCCNDSVWRDPQTNDKFYDPKWFIASTRSDSHWTAEIAIPLNELVDLDDENSRVGKDTAWIIDAKFKKAGVPAEAVFKPDFSTERLLLFR